MSPSEFVADIAWIFPGFIVGMPALVRDPFTSYKLRSKPRQELLGLRFANTSLPALAAVHRCDPAPRQTQRDKV